MGDEVEIEFTQDDCSVEFEQGDLLEVAQAKMLSWAIDRVLA